MHVPLLLFTDVGRAETLLIAVIIGLLSMLLEAIATRGLDNLLIPLGAYAFLRLYLHAPPEALVLRLVVTVSLVAFALAWRRRTSLDDSALVAAALYGYAAWMLGGLEWVAGPAILFLVHVGMWPRTTDRPTDSVWVLLSIVGPGLFWLAVQTAYPGRAWLLPYAVTFGAHLTIIGVSHYKRGRSRFARASHLAAAATAGVLLVLLQVTPLLLAAGTAGATAPSVRSLAAAAACVAAAGVTFYLLLPVLYRRKSSALAIHSVGFALALLSSALAVGSR